MKRTSMVILAIIGFVASTVLGRGSQGRDREEVHLEYHRQQAKALERQNDLIRQQVAQLRRIADLMEAGMR